MNFGRSYVNHDEQMQIARDKTGRKIDESQEAGTESKPIIADMIAVVIVVIGVYLIYRFATRNAGSNDEDVVTFLFHYFA